MYAKLSLWRTQSTEWFKERAHGKWAQAWLFFLSFSESSFSIVAPDVLLVAMLLVNAKRWIYYSIFTTIAGVLGGIFGYAIASYFYDIAGVHIITFYGLEHEMGIVREMFRDSAFWTVFLAAFTPIPYKLFVLAAGFFKINFWVFVIASFAGRLLRYGLIGYAVKRYGTYALRFLTRYFTFTLVAIFVALTAYLIKIILF